MFDRSSESMEYGSVPFRDTYGVTTVHRARIIRAVLTVVAITYLPTYLPTYLGGYVRT